ncbi:dipeptidyl aminopeptidase/acylaminoacyl peptidase [Thermoflavifilum aggregans]|uniref:Dipeptidyl aminopeptidase/acylaminoacyl peptidase n=1 Tax=Thermoflavifilum aggregans TaxID=454188 RepID=A0A2M9CY38_9BACT|nr:prolyl oligopeptidase family serine peptidase [Thermoflavifilum aggregans]PJJ76795.1 dipeptidyl aminopeptidase/acylaminoacyl peptidase [Thermoflavifilum aggregans]
MSKWRYILIGLGWMSGLHVAHAQLVWTPERVAEAPYISACWTDDDAGGQALYYVISSYDIGRDRMRHQLWMQPLNPTAARANRLFTFDGPQPENIIRISPHQFIFTRGNQCYLLRTDTPSLRSFTQVDSPYAHMLISPKKDYVLFVHPEKVRDVDAKDYYPQFGKTRARIYHGLPAFGMDGWIDGYAHHLLYARIDSMGRLGMPVDLMPYEQTDVDTTLINSYLAQVHWSPDERYIVYAAYKPSLQEIATDAPQDSSVAPPASQIYLYDLQDGLTSCLTCETAVDRGSGSAWIRHESPAFSPATSQGKSRWIAWIAESVAGAHTGQRDLILEDLERKTLYNLTHGRAGRVLHFWWSNDGQSLLFTATYPDSAWTELYRVQVLDEGRLHTPLVIRQITHLQARIEALVGETPSTWLVAVSGWHHMQRIFSVDKQNGSARMLVQADTTQDAMPGPSSWLISLAHGIKVWVHQYHPSQTDSGSRYPAIICLPDFTWFSDDDSKTRWDQPQMLADAGYQVFTISSEQGLSDDMLNFYLDPATLHNLADSLYRLLIINQADTQRVILMGSGWGAYLALMWASDQRRASSFSVRTLVLWNPVVDIPSWSTTTAARWVARDIVQLMQKNKNIVQAGWPLAHLPMLIGVGGNDGWVPAEQGWGLFNEIQDPQIPGRLIYFPDIAHHWQTGHDLLVWQHQVLNWLQAPAVNP